RNGRRDRQPGARPARRRRDLVRRSTRRNERGRASLYRRRPPAAGNAPDPAFRTLPLPPAARASGGVPALTAEGGFILSAVLFVGTHFLRSHPLRAPLVRAVGTGPLQGIYSPDALATFGSMIYLYRVIGREPQLWVPGDALWLLATLLVWFGSILFVGSLVRNPALPGARLERGTKPAGVFGITRH